VSWSLRSTPPTRLSTVLTEICSSRAISLCVLPAGDVAEDLSLAGGELVELGVDGQRRLAGKRVEDESSEPRREHGVALVHAADRVGELGG